jgi:hypothetical protein
VYLEGALRRAMTAPVTQEPAPLEGPVFDGPAPRSLAAPRPDAARGHAILDPFSAGEKGEPLLRNQLAALSAWHLLNIIIEYELSNADSAWLSRQPQASLIEVIVDGVRERSNLAPRT